MRFTALATLVASTLAAPRPAAAQTVEHPAYVSWSNAPIGTAVTLRMVTVDEAEAIETTIIDRLVERSDAAVVLERTVRSETAGQQAEPEPQRLTVRRAFPLFGDTKPEDVGKPPGTIAAGVEPIEVAGRTFEARWFDSRGSVEAGPTRTRTWMSDEVPGRLLKSVTEVTTTGTRTTTELIAIDEP